MKILIIDDHSLYRDGLKFNLANIVPEAQILDAENLTQAIEQLKQNSDVNLVLADWDMPEIKWQDGLKHIKEATKNSQIGVIASSGENSDIKKILNMGLCCFLPKNIDTKVLNSALGLVLNGGSYFPPSLLKQQADDFLPKTSKHLTNRQMEVLKYLAQGLSNKQIAYKMNVSEATVKLHINALLRAVGATNRTQAVIKSQQMGIV
ncbi:MAG: response regulator transcription factor [Alphaproteobacteria bacterium]|nr:response regulator transcription factor [Alphaproteobacteria bacterium]